MKTFFLTIAVLLLQTILPVSGQGFIYDQQSATESTGGGAIASIQSFQPIGQSFTPTNSSVGFIRLLLGDTAINSLGATVYVNLWSGSISNGTPLASTDPVYMPDGFGTGFGPVGYTNFFFLSPVAVTPGTTYFFQPVVQSGDDWNVIAYNSYNYPGGTAVFSGVANSGWDLWFREGVIAVPEPSSMVLALLGGGAWLFARRRSGR